MGSIEDGRGRGQHAATPLLPAPGWPGALDCGIIAFAMGRILVGTCNWADHTDFYPPTLPAHQRLTYYARYFPIVEVDATFYRLLPARTFHLWAERTPPDFVFDVKAYRTLTLHGATYAPDRPLADRLTPPPDADFLAFRAACQPLKEAGKLRAILFQFPPWFRCTARNADYLVHCRSFFPDDLVAVEFRHRSWLNNGNTAATLALLRRHGFVFVAVDEPQVGWGSVPPVVAVTNPALAIVRFHGRNAATWYIKGAASSADRFDYLYRREELAEWVPRLQRLAAEAREVHALMNNNRRNYAVRNAHDLMDLLGLQPPPLPLPSLR